MKNRNLITMLLVLLFAVITTAFAVPSKNDTPTKNSIRLLSSPELLELANTWVSEYKSAHPGADISVTLVPEEGLNSIPQNEPVICLVNKKGLSGVRGDQHWAMIVGRDVIVPVMNTENPCREEIIQKGLSPEAFAKVYTPSGVVTWGTLLRNNNSSSVVPYVSGDLSTRAYLADFMNVDADQIKGRETAGMEEMVEHIRNERNAIGFCGLSEVIDKTSGEIISGLSLIPVDVNGNAAIDKFEDIYGSATDLTHGIWIGKYPGTLYSRLYVVSNSSQSENEELAFLEWMIADGQQLLAANGYSSLSRSEKYSRGEQLAHRSMVAIEVPVTISTTKVLLIVLGAILALVACVLLFAKVFGSSSSESGADGFKPLALFGEKSVSFPGGLFFDKSHTWAFMEKDGKVRIGIDDFLQHVTGPITRVIMKNPGERIKKGETFLTLVQQGKKLEIQSPVSGIVAEQNGGLITDSSRINSEPYSEGWVYVVEPLNWLTELKTYAMGDKYSEWLKAEFSRLKDFLSSGKVAFDNVEPVQVMQEGGEIKEGVLEGFGPEVWEEFQTGFINVSV